VVNIWCSIYCYVQTICCATERLGYVREVSQSWCKCTLCLMASVSAVLTLRLSAERRRRLTAVWGAVVRPASPLCPTVTGPSGRTCEFCRRTVGLVSVSSVQMYASYPCAHTCFQSPSCRWVQHKHMLQSFGQTVLMMWLLQSESSTSDKSQPIQNAAEYADTVHISVIIKVMIQADDTVLPKYNVFWVLYRYKSVCHLSSSTSRPFLQPRR